MRRILQLKSLGFTEEELFHGDFILHEDIIKIRADQFDEFIYKLCVSKENSFIVLYSDEDMAGPRLFFHLPEELRLKAHHKTEVSSYLGGSYYFEHKDASLSEIISYYKKIATLDEHYIFDYYLVLQFKKHDKDLGILFYRNVLN